VPVRVAVLVALVSMLACGGGTRPPAPVAPTPVAASAPAIADRDWELLALGADTPPPAGRPVTMRFDAGSRRAAGSAGCNRYSVAYAFRGEGLTFGPAAVTKMACLEGMEFESSFLAMLPLVTRYELPDANTLVLSGLDGPVARFRAP
jgi:heat shock protein HslJ